MSDSTRALPADQADSQAAPFALADVRRRLEANEERLSPLAARSAASRGRARPEEPSPVRTEFQRDRDRIIHSHAFRRLKHKTQVFIAPLVDHYVTRLTHTLEVQQVARTIARGLNLNEDLTEAICMGHDLGHGPFGHVGEKVLKELVWPDFKHNEQSLRIVDVLEKGGQGLNLTWEVRDGILNHSKGKSVEGRERGHPHTLEGQVVKIADSVAYLNHDIGDAIRAGMLRLEDLPQDCLDVLGRSHAQRINTMVCDIIEQSWDKPEVRMSEPVLAATNQLRNFMTERIYYARSALDDSIRASRLMSELCRYFLAHPEDIPEDYRSGAEERGEPIERAVCDYLAGMTDSYAIRRFSELWMPNYRA
ncbi:MAG TPA: deoxyguanosinetriphosphate triphosphohydrolase [Ktedonobacterales bacterium]|nr:deoxyguanosinetriphosphate triphosphohydrolase [Ktedonobacterales bacterium]